MPAYITSTAEKQAWRVILAFTGLMSGAIPMLTSPARADTIIFNDLTESPTLTHIGTDTTVTGSCSGPEDIFGCTITVSHPGQLLVDISNNIPPDGLNLAEDAQLQFFSDQIAVTPENDMLPAASATISFLSLPEGVTEKCSDFPGGCQLQENGQPQGGFITWASSPSGRRPGQTPSRSNRMSRCRNPPPGSSSLPALSASWALGFWHRRHVAA